MSEDYFLYYEEFDWATRARGIYRMGWAPSSVVHHKYGATIEAGGLKYTNIYYLNIGLLRFMRKYHPLLLPLSFVRIFLLMARALLRRQSGVIKILAMAIGDFLSGVRRRGKIEPTT
jgi:GT2 family glycosyltransferase